MPRTELGLVRTECSCPACTDLCRKQPGYLLEADIDRIWRVVAPEMQRSQFIVTYLKPGRGAQVMEGNAENLQFVQYQTITPARQYENGPCVFLKDNKCRIHDVSPFGCAFFDTHMGDIEADTRARIGLDNMKRSLRADGLFSMVLLRLFGVKRHDQIKNVTQKLFPNGIPEKYKQLARFIHSEALKRGKRIYQDPNKVQGTTGK